MLIVEYQWEVSLDRNVGKFKSVENVIGKEILKGIEGNDEQ